jgi:hypothetical protein
MNSQEIDEVLQHLENAQYVGASKAVQIIHQLNKERLRLSQRVLDLKQQVSNQKIWEEKHLDVIERMTEKQSHYEAMAHAGGFEAGRELGMKQERALWELAISTQEIENERK